MAQLWQEFTDKFGGLIGKWTALAAFGSFVLYLFGYLALRFQLTTYGVATNLDAFDEKYLFAGCRFVVYLVSSIPSLLILLLVLSAVFYLPWKLVPSSFKERVEGAVAAWSGQGTHLPVLGVILAVLFIQFVLRRCFLCGDLLLRKNLPAGWLGTLLLSSDAYQALYFTGLIAGTLITSGILFYAIKAELAAGVISRFWLGVLAFLVGVELLLLPVNYGVLIATQQLPRVAATDQKPDGSTSWLVWDTKDSLTYLQRTANDERALVTVSRKQDPIKIIAYDDTLCVLFAADHATTRPCRREQ